MKHYTALLRGISEEFCKQKPGQPYGCPGCFYGFGYIMKVLRALPELLPVLPLRVLPVQTVLPVFPLRAPGFPAEAADPDSRSAWRGA